MNVKQASLLSLYVVVMLTLSMSLLPLIPFKQLETKNISFYLALIRSVSILITFVPVIIFAIRKFQINIREQFQSFNLVILILMLTVTTLLFANILPFSQPIKFFKSVFEGKFLYFQFNTISLNLLFIVHFINSVLLIPIFEEIFFRGIILKGFQRNYKPLFSIIISSLIFAAYHFNPEGIMYLILYGLLTGWAYYRTKSLYVPIVLHMVINILAFVTKTVSYELSGRTLVIYILSVGISVLIIYTIIKYLGIKSSVIKEKENEELLNENADILNND